MKTAGGEYLPVDIDVSVMVNDDCRKEGVGFTVEGSGLDFIAKRNARREDERTWIEQANGEHGESAHSYVDEKDGYVDVFCGVVSHLLCSPARFSWVANMEFHPIWRFRFERSRH